MTSDERKMIVGTAFLERKQIQEQIREIAGGIARIGFIIEKAGQKLKAVNSTVALADDEKAALDAARIERLLTEWREAADRFKVVNEQLGEG
ncbi:MAG: hypothetical protein ACREA9_23330 [Pyrinomonadaceae bacterium]